MYHHIFSGSLTGVFYGTRQIIRIKCNVQRPAGTEQQLLCFLVITQSDEYRIFTGNRKSKCSVIRNVTVNGISGLVPDIPGPVQLNTVFCSAIDLPGEYGLGRAYMSTA